MALPLPVVARPKKTSKRTVRTESKQTKIRPGVKLAKESVKASASKLDADMEDEADDIKHLLQLTANQAGRK